MKNNVLFKQYKKDRPKEIKLFKNLISNPTFQEHINRYRKNHNVPKNGFKNYDERIKWEKEQSLIKVEGQYSDETITLDYNDKPTIKVNEKGTTTMSKYIFDAYFILDEFDLSIEWFPYIYNYLISGDKSITKLNVNYPYLKRITFKGIITYEEIYWQFGATMKSEYIVSKLLGKTIWNWQIEPLQQLMRGYKEKKKRPSRSKINLKRKIYIKRKSKKPYIDIQYDLDDEINTTSTARSLLKRLKNN